ncbi:MAG: hypothetical protein AAB573_04145 [Patescibacteria group bacterium]
MRERRRSGGYPGMFGRSPMEKQPTREDCEAEDKQHRKYRTGNTFIGQPGEQDKKQYGCRRCKKTFLKAFGKPRPFPEPPRTFYDRKR